MSHAAKVALMEVVAVGRMARAPKVRASASSPHLLITKGAAVHNVNLARMVALLCQPRALLITIVALQEEK